MANLVELVANMDKRVLYAIIAIAVILVIVSFAKKAIKLAVSVLAVTVLFSCAKGGADSIKDKYWVTINNGAIVATVDGEQYSIPVDSIAEVRVEDVVSTKGNNTVITVSLVNGAEHSLEVPRIVASVVEGVAEKAGIEIQK